MIDLIIDAMPGLLVPFLGTSLGALMAVFIRGELNGSLQRALAGLAAGIMTAASVWSLLLPAIDRSAALGPFAFLPSVVGLFLGFGFIMLLDGAAELFAHRVPGDKNSLLVFAVTIHNLPEGMAVGVVYAGLLAGDSGISAMEAFALALGIAIQNFPEGAIISLPLAAGGMSRQRAVFKGIMSGAVEPLGALITLLAFRWIVPLLPYFLSFAAGAMIYVVVEELVPELLGGGESRTGMTMFAIGFAVMMALDVALG